ncbi:creatininase family protein [Microbacterium sp.]|uniref:creatininase family protein n=1 Tax=Microbacterium sp. TaxID=51671 RepID=UPI003341A2E4
MKTFYPDLTWTEAAEAAAAGRVAILPIGTVDANGPLTPMGFDYVVSEELAKTVAERTGSLWLPSLAYGVSEALDGFPGTITMPPEHLAVQVDAVVRSLIRAGFDHILLVTNHGPNQFPVEYACRRIRRDTGVLVASVNPAQLSGDLRGTLFDGGNPAIGHGSEPGVSLLMHLRPGAVDLTHAERRPKSDFQGLEVITPTEVRFGASRVNLYLELEEVSPTAGWADPTEASAQKGEALFAAMADYVTEFVETFRGLDTRAAAPEVIA